MRTILALLLCAASLFAAEIGSKPSFTVKMPGKTPVQVQSYHGKVLVLVFMLTTCPHCQDLIAKMGPIYKEYAPKGVEVLACAIDQPDGEKKVPGFIAQYKPAFPLGYTDDPQAVDAIVGRSVMDARPFYVPHVLIFDKAGKLTASYGGMSAFITGNPAASLRTELDGLLAAKSK